jgi:hypothetical protein
MIGPIPRDDVGGFVEAAEEAIRVWERNPFAPSNTIVVSLTPTGASVSLTIEQAKFLAANPISPQDLVAERYPQEWPCRWSYKAGRPRR